MPCNLYDNNGFGCGGCTHFVKTNDITLNNSVLELNIPEETYNNKEKVCICVAQTIPDVKNTDKVTVTIGKNATQYPLVTRRGNFVHADQIRSRKVYHTNVATDTAVFLVSPCELCKTSFNFPVLPDLE